MALRWDRGSHQGLRCQALREGSGHILPGSQARPAVALVPEPCIRTPRLWAASSLELHLLLSLWGLPWWAPWPYVCGC